VLPAAAELMPMTGHRVVERVSQASGDQPRDSGEAPGTSKVLGHAQSGR
jgi:hypothetical protein